LRNSFEGITAQLRATGLDGDVPQRHDSDQLSLFAQHWDPPDLLLAHQDGGLFDFLIIKASDDLRSHRITDLGAFGISAFRNDADRDVSIRQHAKQPIILSHGYGADARGLHFFCGLHGLGIRRNGFYALRHDLSADKF
jgi:hypothetical protein